MENYIDSLLYKCFFQGLAKLAELSLGVKEQELKFYRDRHMQGALDFSKPTVDNEFAFHSSRLCCVYGSMWEYIRL